MEKTELSWRGKPWFKIFEICPQAEENKWKLLHPMAYIKFHFHFLQFFV